MSRAAAIFVAAMLLFHVTFAQAAEKGLVIRAGDLMAQPFIDSAKTSAVTANQPVTILARRGGWANVSCNGQTGWIRLLNIRLDPNSSAVGSQRSNAGSGNPLALLRTGSSSQTVTTGVKGMDEENIRNAVPNDAELERLGTLSVDAAEARANAKKNDLKESAVAYLDKGRGR